MDQREMFTLAQHLSSAINSTVPLHSHANAPTTPLQGLLWNEPLEPILAPDVLKSENQQSALTSFQGQQASSSNNTLPQVAYADANHARHISSGSTNSTNSVDSANSVPSPSSYAQSQYPFPPPVSASIPVAATAVSEWPKADDSHQSLDDLASFLQVPTSSASLPLDWSSVFDFDFDFNTSRDTFDGVFDSGTGYEQAFDGSTMNLPTGAWDPLHLGNNDQEAKNDVSPSLAVKSTPVDASAIHISTTINSNLNGLNVKNFAGATPIKGPESPYGPPSRKRKRSQDDLDRVETRVSILPLKDDLVQSPSEKRRSKQRCLGSPRPALMSPPVINGLKRKPLVCPTLQKENFQGVASPSPAWSSPRTPLTTSIYPLSPMYHSPLPYPPAPLTSVQATPLVKNATIPSNSNTSSPVIVDPVAEFLQVTTPTAPKQYACRFADCKYKHLSSENKLRVHEFKDHGIEHSSLFYCRKPECLKERKCFPTQAGLKQHRKRHADNEAKRLAKEEAANGLLRGAFGGH